MVPLVKKTAVDRCVSQENFKSLAELARVCCVDVATPSHWNQPKTMKNGRGGAVPDKYFPKILEAARKRRLPLKPEDLINV